MPEGFLEAAGWGGAERSALAGDASRRRYERLRLGAGTAILMVAPAGSAAEIVRFDLIARHLTGLGLSSPRVLASAPEAGLMLLEDLGDSLYSSAIAADPGLEPRLYRAALDCLLVLQAAPPPAGLSPFGAEEMARQAALAHDAYAGAGPNAACPFEAPLRAALEAAAPNQGVLMLRDFHAGNLFWLPERVGPAKVGLIDFQDARLAAPLYDIVSLLFDARRDLAPGLTDTMLTAAADGLGRPRAEVAGEAALLSLQRNLRVLGVFARLAVTEGKTGYLDHLPRVWRHVETALASPGLAALRDPVLGCLPPPSPSHLSRLRLPCDPTPAR